jgi:hypothetical protein
MNTKNKIAIDIVLLLPTEIVEHCIEINSKFDNPEYVSFKDGYNPHITLGMGSILMDDVENFKKELGQLLQEFEMPEITLTSLGIGKYTHFNLDITGLLKNLHNAIFDLISKYNAGDVTTENFFEMDKSSSLIDWVNNYKNNSAYDKYHPHITLGIGTPEIALEFPIIFKPKSVGFFHLGIHGTCKKLIASFDLD